MNNVCELIEEPPCTEDWSCTEWLPEICPVEEIQTRTCTDANECGTTVDKPAESQSCEYVPPVTGQTVIFRTDVEDDNYRFDAAGSWIAVDCNQDGVLEAYTGIGTSRTSKVNDPIGYTPSGYGYQCYNGREVRIHMPLREIIYLSDRAPDSTPELSTSPVEPYASNNQEVYAQ